MTVTAYIFSKSMRSTKQPSNSDTHNDITCTLKDPVDVLSPTFLFTTTEWSAAYNYIKATLTGKTRYYRVNEARIVNNSMVEVSCIEDKLATWKTEIKASSQFIERSSDSTLYSTSINSHIIDMAYPSVAGSFFQSRNKSNVFDQTGGYFVLGVIGENIYTGTQRGLVRYVVLTLSQYHDLEQELVGLTYSATDKNPIDYIVSCYYVPFTFDANDFTSHTSSWTLGSYTLGPLTYYGFSSTYSTGLVPVYYDTIALPDHTYYTTRGKSFNFEPWIRYHMFAGPFGDFDIPTDQLSGDNNRSIGVYIAVDVCTGEGALHIMQGSRMIIAMTTPICPQVMLTQISSNSLFQQYQTGQHLASSLASAIKFDFGGSASNMGAAIMSSYAAGIPKITSIGSNGSIAGIYDEGIHLYALELTPTDDDTTHIGRPVMSNTSLSSVAAGAFVKTRNAKLEIPAYQIEIEVLTEAMDAGFYLD